jgi:hypothetical protein
MPLPPLTPCRSCAGVEHWLSVHGIALCLRCHPRPQANR